MKTAYAISSGSYSDYSVACVCLDEGLAKRLAERLNRHKKTYTDDYEVEEFPLVESLDDQIERTRYYVEVDGEGKEVKRWIEILHFWTTDEAGTPENAWVHTAAPHPSPDPYSAPIRKTSAEAYSERGHEVALKAARDRLAHHKAEQQLLYNQ